jgi:hypothetical protein
MQFHEFNVKRKPHPQKSRVDWIREKAPAHSVLAFG